MATYPPLINRTIAGFRTLLTSLGIEIVVRNPAKTLTDPRQVWYKTFEYYNEFAVRALPITEGEYDNAYKYEMPTRRVGIGSFAWAFLKGEEDVSTLSVIKHEDKFYPVKEVRGRIWYGDSPIVQHAVVSI